MLERIAKQIVRFRIQIIILAIMLAVPAVYGTLNQKINYDLNSYLPGNLNSVKGQKILNEKFGTGSAAAILIEGKSDNEVERLRRKIENIDGVASTAWISDFTDITIPREYIDQELIDRYYSKDSTILEVRFSASAADPKTADAVHKIQGLDKDLWIVGAATIIGETQDIVKPEMPWMGLLAVFLILIVLFISLSSYIVPIIFLVILGLAILYNMGIPFYFNQEVSFVTGAIGAALQLGVTMDYAVFLLHRFEEEHKERPLQEAMVQAIVKTSKAITSSSLTTIMGFLAMVVMALGFGADLGFALARGVFISLIVVLTVLPAVILVLEKWIERFKHRVFMPKFTSLGWFATRHYVFVFLAFLLLFVPAIYGYTNTKIAYDMGGTFPEDSKYTASIGKIKEEFGSAETANLITKDIPDSRLEKVKQELSELDGVKGVIGYSDYVDPAVPKELVPKDVKDRFFAGDYINTIINFRYTSSDERTDKTVKEAQRIINKYGAGEDSEIYFTGSTVLTRDLMISAQRDTRVVAILSASAIFLMVALAFKSISLPMILIGAIELAILLNQSVSFYLNQSIFFFAALAVGTIQLGATVDYAILLTSRYEEELANYPPKKAMHLAVAESGQAIATSAFTLFGATLGLGLASSLGIVRDLTLLLARGTIISLLVVTILLPGILVLFTRAISVTTWKWPKPGINKKTTGNH